MKRAIVLCFSALFLSACGQLDTILYTPTQTPETWLQIQPYAELELGSAEFIIVQPSTSIIVYVLGPIAFAGGIYFLKIRADHRSRYWWGIALLLWGIGAILAGTSYEAFSYDIKCAGREACVWTSWWEIAYLVISVWSVDAIVLAIANSSVVGKFRERLYNFALINAVVYFIIVMIGVFIPVKFLISFEFLLIFAAPGVLILFFLSAVRYSRFKQKADLILLAVGLWLGITIAAYFVYYFSGATAVLWAKGIWFSDNDVLHIGLILWMFLITFVLAPHVEDIPA